MAAVVFVILCAPRHFLRQSYDIVDGAECDLRTTCGPPVAYFPKNDMPNILYESVKGVSKWKLDLFPP